MKVPRGDVVLIDYPYAGGVGTKVRPALVVQNDRDNHRLVNTVVAQITGTTRRALEATQTRINLATPEGIASGLKFDSVVNCGKQMDPLFANTLEKVRQAKRTGHAS